MYNSRYVIEFLMKHVMKMHEVDAFFVQQLGEFVLSLRVRQRGRGVGARKANVTRRSLANVEQALQPTLGKAAVREEQHRFEIGR